MYALDDKFNSYTHKFVYVNNLKALNTFIEDIFS